MAGRMPGCRPAARDNISQVVDNPRQETEEINSPDHHQEYLSRAVAALTPEGRERVGVLRRDLAGAAPGHAWRVRFANVRESEVDTDHTTVPDDAEPARMLTEQELDGLTLGFRTIRDQEPLDDVTDWANAVLALLKDVRTRNRHRRGTG